MKTIWEEKDIKSGIYVCREPEDGETFKPSGWTCKWTYKVGYIGGSANGTVLVCMADGMVTEKCTPKELAERLTEDGMIPMPHKWLIESLEYMRDWYTS